MAEENASSRRWASLLPREHGAYVQLGISLSAGLALGHVGLRGLGQASLSVACFLACEPMLILLGHRGSQARVLKGIPARRWLLTLGIAAALLAVPTWMNPPSAAWRSLVIPGLLAALLSWMVYARKEHTATGELVAAWAFSAAGFPVAVLDGVDPPTALRAMLLLIAIQSLGTIVVRSFLSSLRRKARVMPAFLPVLLGLGLMTACLTLPFHSSWVTASAFLPNTGIALWVLLRPTPPKSMKRLGWALTAGSTLGISLVLASLR